MNVMYAAMADSHRAKAAEYRLRANRARHGLLRAHDERQAREHERAMRLYMEMASDVDPVEV